MIIPLISNIRAEPQYVNNDLVFAVLGAFYNNWFMMIPGDV